MTIASFLSQLTRYPFMVSALEAGTIVGAMAGVVGWFVVLRRQAFASHTLSVMAFPGASGALLAGVAPAAGYFAFVGVGAILIGVAPRGRHTESALTGTFQALGLACGFLFLSLYGGVLGGYESLLFGSFLGITKAQVWTLGIVAAATLVALWIVGRPLLFCSIDAKVARARGVPAKALGFGFLLILGMAVAETAQITGALLVFTLLIGPPATARLITARIGLGIAISVTGAIAIAWASLALSYFYGHPVGFYMGTLALGAYLTALAGRALAERSS